MLTTRTLPRHGFFPSQNQSLVPGRFRLEILEQRIAPAAVLSFIDLDSNGDASRATGPSIVEGEDASVSVAVAPSSVTEDGGAGLVYTFTRTGDTAAALLVNFFVGGNAAFTSDYTATSTAADFRFDAGSGTITLAAGQTSGTVTLAAVNDTLVEGGETAVLGVTSGSGYTANPALATGTITDNDFATISFASPTSTVSEATAVHNIGVALLITANGVVGLGSLAQEVSIDLANLLTGTATASGVANDYTLASPTKIVFAAGAVSSTQNRQVTLINDARVEGNETVNLALTGFVDGTGGVVTFNSAPHTLTVTDDDTAKISFASATSTVGEAAGADVLGFVLTIAPGAGSTGTASLTRDVTFNVGFVVSGTTASGGGIDYTRPVAMTFNAGSVDGATQTGNVAIVNDALVEGPETVLFGLPPVASDGTGGQVLTATDASGYHTTTITDNDTATIGFSTASSTVNEASGVDLLTYVMTITANGTGTPMLGRVVIVNTTVIAGGTATNGPDFTLPAPVSFDANSLSGATATAVLGITNDNFFDPTETVMLGLAIPSNLGGQVTIAGGAAASHTTTITDDDFGAAVSISPGSVAEDAAGRLIFTFTRGGSTTGAATVNFALGGTATFSSNDFSLLLPVGGTYSSLNSTGTVAFAAGETTKTLSALVQTDRAVESDETVTVTLTGGTGIAGPVFGNATGVIVNDDATVLVSISPNSVTEDGAGNLVYTFTRTGATANALTVNFTSGGTATFNTDYSASGSQPGLVFSGGAGSVNFAAGATTTTITIDPVADTLGEAHETVALTVASQGPGYTGGNGVTGTILDDDTTVSVAIQSTVVAEDGTTGMLYTFTRTGKYDAALPVTFGVGGNATFNRDYQATSLDTGFTFTTSGGTVTIPAGAASAAVRLVPLNDTLVEGSETAVLSVMPGSFPVTGDPATGTITDNDFATISFVGPGTLDTGENVDSSSAAVQLTITADGVSGLGSIERAVSVSVQDSLTGTATASVDYSAFSSFTATFPSGALSGTQAGGNFTFTNDALVEGNETINLRLANLVDGNGGAVILGGLQTQTIRLGDDDTATLTLATAADSVSESAGTKNAAVILKINSNGTGPIGLGSALTANLNLTGGTAGAGDVPFPAVTTFAAGTYASGTATQNAELQITDDRIVEGDERAGLDLAIAQNIGNQVSLVGITSEALTIMDNDTATIGFGSEASTRGEPGGALPNVFLTFKVIGAGNTFGLASAITADLTVTGGTATSGMDFTLPNSAAFTFAAGTYFSPVLSRSIGLPIIDDRIVEGTEFATFGLTILQNIGSQVALEGSPSYALTIADNDTATLDIALGKGTVSETVGTTPVGVTLTIHATGSGESGLASAVSVNLAPLLGSATSADYTLPASPAVTFAAGTYEIGSATQNALVTLVNDRLVEGSEQVTLGLNMVQNIGAQVTIVPEAEYVLVITDNDRATLSIAPTPTLSEGGGAQTVLLTLTTSDGAGGTATLAPEVTVFTDVVAWTPGTATEDVDFTAFGTQRVTFAPGSGNGAVGTVTLTPTDDTAVEGNETVYLSFQDPRGPIGGGNSQSAVTIADNDTAVITFDTPTSLAAEGAGAHAIGVKLVITGNGVVGMGTLGRDVAVNLQDLLNGSATGSGTDYALANPTTVTFAPGEGSATKNVSIVVLNDALLEGNEAVNLQLDTLSDGSAGQVQLGTSAEIMHLATIVDNDIDLKLTRTESAVSVVAGSGAGNLVYVLTLANLGALDATGVVVAEDLTLPAGTTVESIVASAGTYATTADPDGQWTLDLAQGQSATLTVTLSVGSATVAGTEAIADTATILQAAQQLVNVADDSASESTSVITSADLAITNTTNSVIIVRGRQIAYGITLTNAGPSDVIGATITDLFPAGLTSVTYIASGDAGTSGFANGTGILQQTVDLPVGTSITYTVTGTVASNLVGTTIINTARIVTGSDANLGNNAATVQTPLYQGIYVVAPGSAFPKKIAPPTVRVFDSSTATDTLNFLAYEATYRGGIRVAVGDLNGDGFDDIVTTTEKGTGRLRVFDGLTGTQFSSGPFAGETAVFDGKKDKGAFVAVGDVTGDGRADIVLGSALGGKKLRVLDSVTGAPIMDALPFGPKFTGGVQVAVGDVNGDGIGDIIAGQGSRGAIVKVFGGSQQLDPTAPALLQELKIGPESYRGGVSVAAADVDGDGRADLIIGRSSGKPSQVEVFSAVDLHALGAPILPLDVNPAKPKSSSGVRVAAADLNFDGIAEIIVGAGVRGNSQVQIYDGATRLEIVPRALTAYPAFLNGSVFVAGSSLYSLQPTA